MKPPVSSAQSAISAMNTATVWAGHATAATPAPMSTMPSNANMLQRSPLLAARTALTIAKTPSTIA